MKKIQTLRFRALAAQPRTKRHESREFACRSPLKERQHTKIRCFYSAENSNGKEDVIRVISEGQDESRI